MKVINLFHNLSIRWIIFIIKKFILTKNESNVVVANLNLKDIHISYIKLLRHSCLLICKYIINKLSSLFELIYYPFYFLFHPRFWIMNDKYWDVWDREFNRLLDTYEWGEVTQYTARLGAHRIWISNYPYGAFTIYSDSFARTLNFRPSRKTILKAHKSLLKHITNHNTMR